MCFTQRHIKRLLAYSTIAHIGLFTIGLAALSPLGIAGSALWLAGHAGIKGALFLLTGLLLTRYRSVDELTLFGRARDHRWIGGLFVLGSLALAGLPPFGAGLGKALLEEADKSVWAVVLTIAVSAVTGGAALRVALRVYFGLGVAPPDKSTVDEVTGRNEEPDASAPRGGRTPATMLAAVLVLLVAGARRVAGDRPRRRPAAVAFVDQRGYWAQALTGSTGGATVSVPDTGWTTSGVLLGLLSAGLAVLMAFAALYAGRLPEWARRAAGIGRPAMAELHRLHTGHIGDYAAWLVFGAAAIAGLLTL